MDCMRNNFVAGVLLDGRYRTISPLNHGSFGMVFKAYDTFTGEFVALKCLTKNSAANTCPSAIAIDEKSEELTVHRRIGNHANIVNLLHSFETASHVYLVLEYCSNGDLYEAIRVGRGPLQTEHVRDFMFQLIDAIEHMHKNGIYHRDIKPENIFLTQSGAMKLGDFGLATSDFCSFEAAVGSDRYMAPEQYDPSWNGYNPARADIWSIGICLLNILFSRNPFAQPTASDPLYRDFVADRQTLFDVFPTMSQDTFEFLVHCLAIDPANRSLTAAKEALKRIVSFTTDDEALDDFCTDDRAVAMATANREPLRTPSISTPQVGADGAFPWAKALAMSPPQQIRQLSAIPDTEFSESLFPSSEDESKDWASSKPETASIASFVDSGLGVSIKSTNTIPQPIGEPIKVQRSKPVPISGSLPISAARPIGSLAQVFKGRDTMSKSWSDMFEEDEEAAESSDVENSVFGFGAPIKAIKSKDWGYESSDGRSTPRNRQRVGLSEMKNSSAANNSRNRSPQAPLGQEVDDRISEHTGFLFEDATLATPTKPRKTTDFLDKWAKLGARRRAEPESKSATTSGSATPKQSTATKREAGPVQTPRKRSQTRVGSWRGRRKDTWVQHGNGSDVWESGKKDGNSNGTLKTAGDRQDSGNGKEWSLSKDWRQHSPTQNRQHSYHNWSARNHWHDFGAHGHGGGFGASDFEWVWRSSEALHL